jgi:hypothetical protein
MDNQKKMSSMIKKMWMFLKFGATMHGLTSGSNGGKVLLFTQHNKHVRTMGEVCSSICYATLNKMDVSCLTILMYKCRSKWTCDSLAYLS